MVKIVYLQSTVQDLLWFRHHYRSVFPEGSHKAQAQVRAMLAMLAANPYAGHRSDTGAPVRELHIPRTPFTLIYRVTPEQIELLRVWDMRQGADF